MYWGIYAKWRLLTPGDNPGGHAALSAHYAVVLPASPVIRRQISICTAVTVLLSQIWDIQLKVYTLPTYPGHRESCALYKLLAHSSKWHLQSAIRNCRTTAITGQSHLLRIKFFNSFIALQDFKLYRNMFRFWYQNPLTTPPRDVFHVLYSVSVPFRWYHDNDTDTSLYTYHCQAPCIGSGEVVVNRFPQRRDYLTLSNFKECRYVPCGVALHPGPSYERLHYRLISRGAVTPRSRSKGGYLIYVLLVLF